MRPGAPLRVTPTISIDPAELEESFVRADGPGGQHVNKTASAVQLRFDVRGSPSLPDVVRARLERLAGRRLGADGFITIVAREGRSQWRNRADARARLVALIAEAARPPARRVPTRTPRSSKLRRLDDKKRRGALKATRRASDE